MYTDFVFLWTGLAVIIKWQITFKPFSKTNLQCLRITLFWEITGGQLL